MTLSDPVSDMRWALSPAPQARDRQEGGDHYRDLTIEPWNVIDTWSLERQIGFHLGNIVKYALRLGAKDSPLLEAKKIQHYAEKLVEVLARGEGKA